MLIYLKIAVVTLVVCQVFMLLLPPIIVLTKDQKHLQGSTARNNSIYIWIDPDQKNFMHILAQETYECLRQKWIYNVFRWHISDNYKRVLEATGQEVEVQSLFTLKPYSSYLKEYRKKQAESLVKKYKQFKGHKVDDVESLMIRQTDHAKKWLRKNPIDDPRV